MSEVLQLKRGIQMVTQTVDLLCLKSCLGSIDIVHAVIARCFDDVTTLTSDHLQM